MFELLALGAVALGLYYFVGREQELAPSTLDARFEKALKDVTGDRSIFAASEKATNPDPTGAPPSDAAIKKAQESVELLARDAWLSGDPHKMASAAAEFRAGLKFDISVESKKKIVALTEVYRDKIDALSNQGALVDTIFSKIDKMPKMTMEDLDKPENVAAFKSIEDDIATVDWAARQPYTGTIDELSIRTADVINSDGVVNPVFSKVHLYTVDTTQKIDTPVSVQLVRYVKRVSGSKGAASVFIGRVTSAVPNEYYERQIYVFAPVGLVPEMEPFGVGAA